MPRVPAPLPHLAALVVLVLAAGPTSGCGAEGTEAPQAGPTGPMVEITIEDGRITPVAADMEVAAGEAVELVVKSDAQGQIHVHSVDAATTASTMVEEQYRYEPGTTTFALEVDDPGLVAVELHDPDQLLVQLEVR